MLLELEWVFPPAGGGAGEVSAKSHMSLGSVIWRQSCRESPFVWEHCLGGEGTTLHGGSCLTANG